MTNASTQSPNHSRVLAGLALGALGVVYGDIGTSPLYALRECFNPAHHLEPTHEHVLGILSLIFWSLTIIVSGKYLSFVMRADNKGEGGILSLLSLAFPESKGKHGKYSGLFIGLGIFGAALLYGDGMITPAITVLGAIEGINIATPAFEHWVVPITVAILVVMFSFQRHGTGRMGNVFGPVMVVWFTCLAVLGIRGIMMAPQVLGAVNPLHAFKFLRDNGMLGFVVMGSVFLAITGAEALYADMGHFGRKPIRRAWFVVVMPALLLNYLGQGALMLQNPAASKNPFYLLAPSWAIFPLVILATAASVIASQALISGAFSITMQAIQLGFCPRMKVDHTSSSARGQIYIPYVNWMLMFSCIGLVLGFRSSGNLAAAYGIAVSLTMTITTVLFFLAARQLWKWNGWLAAGLCGLFFAIEAIFLGSNLLKVGSGGWFPLLVGAVIFTLMTTWKSGRRILRERLRAASLPMKLFLDDIAQNSPVRVPGTAVFLSGNPEGTPIALLHNLKHNRVLHKRVIILTLKTADVPHIDEEQRVSVENLGNEFYRVCGCYGFMEDPNVPDLLSLCTEKGLEFNEAATTYFLSRETLIATKNPGMAIWRETLFAFMARNAQPATTFFRLPANRVVELGMQVEL